MKFGKLEIDPQLLFFIVVSITIIILCKITS